MTAAPMSEGELRAILDGCKGVTPGPWSHYRDHLRPGFKGFVNEVQSPRRREAIVKWSGFDNSNRSEKKHALNAAHIARLDPSTVASIVTELLALRAPRKEQGAVIAWRYRNSLGEIVSEWIDGVPPEFMRDINTNERFATKDMNIDLAYASPNGGREERDAALSDIAAERERQKAVEGWTAEHDDNHVRGEMALAAAAYAVTDWPTGDIADIAKGVLWPWDGKWWKPKDFRNNLVRAAALLVAEIERHDRKEAAIALRAQPHVEGMPE